MIVCNKTDSNNFIENVHAGEYGNPPLSVNGSLVGTRYTCALRLSITVNWFVTFGSTGVLLF